MKWLRQNQESFETHQQRTKRRKKALPAGDYRDYAPLANVSLPSPRSVRGVATLKCNAIKQGDNNLCMMKIVHTWNIHGTCR